jgi:hypothetical protein
MFLYMSSVDKFFPLCYINTMRLAFWKKKKIAVPQFDATQAQSILAKSKDALNRKQLDTIKECIQRVAEKGQNYVHWDFIAECNVKSLEALGFKVDVQGAVGRNGDGSAIYQYKITW